MGRTIAGSTASREEAFLEVVPGLLSGGLTKSAQVVKTAKKGFKGFQGYNKFVKEVPGVTTTSGLPVGMTWQQRASSMYEVNKINQQTLTNFGITRNVLNVVDKTKKEINK